MEKEMDNMSEILLFAGVALVGLFALKFLIKLPFYLVSLAILGALGYAVYQYVLPMLGM